MEQQTGSKLRKEYVKAVYWLLSGEQLDPTHSFGYIFFSFFHLLVGG